ncbi:hypothetical protein ENUP19_0016G0006 [Entamoeba nuttalli]|uniref:Serine/threonine-protein phosphatase n=2 Tax=Entamoeba nuttalli TaxID=412467 RepID=K2GTS0_ENTNP|nr:calcineurin catalytic subunit A, putative [Entamoeba nuttalli P19]EKE38448.1 calcineurin catalytic subunit A, putative [Entamoeba nuttalli P19]|eukprot:XP_008859214.1 calcineurin catalytic subunit A, putative [Entamoeba nuttalli P19]
MTILQSKLIIPRFNGKYDLNVLRDHFMKGGIIEQNCLISLIKEVSELTRAEPNLIEIENAALVFGDFHGQYFDFLSELSDNEWDKYQYTTVFLGDYVDRGEYSCEILITLLCMKVNNPNGVILLRGNHESRSMTEKFGFKTETIWKYNTFIYDLFCEFFNTIPLAALFKCSLGSFLLCHGGISPKLNVLDDIRYIDRFTEPPHSGLFCDLLWSDPTSDSFFAENPNIKWKWETIGFLPNSPRNCSFIYGYAAMSKFIENTQVRAIIRGHQCVSNGIELHNFGDIDLDSPLAFTIFSAPNYSDRNKGAGMLISDTGINVRTYNGSDLISDYKPILVDGFKLSLQLLVKEVSNLWDDFLYYVYDTYDSDDEKEDDLDISHLADKISEYEKVNHIINTPSLLPSTSTEEINNETETSVVYSKQVVEHPTVSPTGKKRIPMRKRTKKTTSSDTGLSLSSTFEKYFKTPKAVSLAASIVSEKPTIYERKKLIRAESAPISIEELRKKWEELRKNHSNQITKE